MVVAASSWLPLSGSAKVQAFIRNGSDLWSGYILEPLYVSLCPLCHIYVLDLFLLDQLASLTETHLYTNAEFCFHDNCTLWHNSFFSDIFQTAKLSHVCKIRGKDGEREKEGTREMDIHFTWNTDTIWCAQWKKVFPCILYVSRLLVCM